MFSDSSVKKAHISSCLHTEDTMLCGKGIVSPVCLVDYVFSSNIYTTWIWQNWWPTFLKCIHLWCSSCICLCLIRFSPKWRFNPTQV